MQVGLTLVVTLAMARGEAARADAGPPGPPSYRADAFTDFVGINGGPIRYHDIPDGQYKGAGRTYDPRVFCDLGIRYYRTALFNELTLPDHPDQVRKAWETHGVRAMLLISPTRTKTIDELLAKLKRFTPQSVAEVEGANEVNNKFPPQELNLHYAGKTDEAAGAAYMTEVYRAIKADPQTKGIPVIAYTAIFTDYALAKGFDAFDFANMHSCQGYNVPSSSLLMNETRANNVLPPGATIRPYVPTECGYNVETDQSNGTYKTGSHRAQALNIPMLLAEYFRHGIRRAYLFSLDNGDGFGLIESDLKTRRPSYFAVKNLLAQVKDAQWNARTHKWEGGDGFKPRSLLFTLDGAPATVHTLTLQKQSSEYLLLIWNEVTNFNEATKKDIVNQAVPVTLHFTTPLHPTARILTQTDAGTYSNREQKLEGSALRVEVPSSVAIVKLQPRPQADQVAPAVPEDVHGTATENCITLTWKPSRAKDLVGYFVFRNDALVATTKGTSYDDASAWIRPGLGYRYAVQAYDRAGNLSPRREVVVPTPDDRPDLIVSHVEVPECKPGDKVRFRASVRNVGRGATPHETEVGVTFFVDGQHTSFATAPKVLQPGESLALEAGGAWTASPGAHILRVMTDDINRVLGEANENNNDADRSLLVDVTCKGSLRGASDPAPGQVDLTQEGTLDWLHWGLNENTSVVRKAGADLIHAELKKSGEGYRDATPGFGMSVKWSDGSPVREMSDTHASLWWNGVGHGYTMEAPADTGEHILRVYVGGIEGGHGKLTAHLSDGSAPDYVSTTWNGNRAFDWSPVPGGFTAVYTLRYRAASPGQTLQVTWTLDGEPNRFLGQARLQAVTLAPGR